MDGFGEKSVENLEAAIEKARDIELWRFLYAIGIPEVGETTAKLLAKRFGNLDGVRGADAATLIEINGIGEVMANKIVQFFADENNKRVLDNLLEQIKIQNSNPGTLVSSRIPNILLPPMKPKNTFVKSDPSRARLTCRTRIWKRARCART